MIERLIFITIGTLAMLILSVFRKNTYQFPLWKSIVFPFLLTISGVAGTMMLAYIETGSWGGISFYGSVLLIPILLAVISLVLRVPYAKLLDYSVPQICIMLAAMKVHCYISGCCCGRLLFVTEAGTAVSFPSQIVEMVNALILMTFILLLDRKEKYKGSLYGMFFLIYGITRFILNFFRAGLTPFVWIIPAGHFWSIFSIVIGAIWIFVHLLRKETHYGNKV